MELEAAIEVFAKGFSAVKSAAHPYLAERLDDLWVLRDGPGRKAPRLIEVFSQSDDPAATVASIRNAGLGWHAIVAFHVDDDRFRAVREGFKALGYRALHTEWMFDHDLRAIPEFDSDPPVRIVASQAELDAVTQSARQPRKVRPGRRLHGVWDDARDYGWVSASAVGSVGWVSDLFVYSEYRGRGYGRALMSSLLLADRAEGHTGNVIVASSAGARLYPHLGYRKLATIQVFTPLERP